MPDGFNDFHRYMRATFVMVVMESQQVVFGQARFTRLSKRRQSSIATLFALR
jgi:hypothetical protein